MSTTDEALERDTETIHFGALAEAFWALAHGWRAEPDSAEQQADAEQAAAEDKVTVAIQAGVKRMKEEEDDGTS